MSIKIGNKNIGKNQPVFIIAEAGINYNNNLKLAYKMIDSISNYKKTLSNSKKIKKKLSRFLINPQVSKYISYCNNILSGFNK